MIKKPIKIYLDNETMNRLKNKSVDVEIEGKAWLARYLDYISRRDIVFLDENVKKLANLFRLEQK